jgi:hypothetical protein
MPGHPDIPDFPDIRSNYVGAITGHGELIAVLPLLLGYRPVNSLIVVTFTGSTQTMSGFLRDGLPAPQDVPVLVAQLRDTLAASDVAEVSPVVLGGGLPSRFGPLPQWGLVHALTIELRAAGITVRHPVWAASTDHAAPWRCYRVCRCGGAIPALDTSPVAAELIMAGATISDSRELLANTLAADPDDQLERRAAMLHDILRSPTATELTGDTGLRLVHDAIAAAASIPTLPQLSDTQIVHLACALTDPAVRDQCLAAALPRTPHAPGSPTASDHADAAERLWTALTRAVPGPHRAHPAFLLSMHADLGGRSVLAAIALDITLDADPHHPGAPLLQSALQQGITPAQLRHALHHAVTENLDD